MFALVDCNSMYASCEQIFRPDLRGKPVVVLSNNDGCIVARSKEAKSLNIPELQPFFKVENLLVKHQVAVFSSNYALYGDISNRVMTTLKDFSPQVEIYSVDEAFLSIAGMHQDLKEYGQEIKNRLWNHVRMPVCVGMAPSKTLAKLANRVAKKIPQQNGVTILDRADKWTYVLQRIPVTDIWGIAKRMAARLEPLGIHSAYDLARANPKVVRRLSNINLERTIEELNGRACLALEEQPPAKKQIYCTRSFGNKTNSLAPLLEAVSQYAARAAEKLRQQNHLVVTMHIFIHTSPFKPDYYSASDMVKLPFPTDDTRLIVGLARRTAKRLYREGKIFSKAGVGLVELVDRKHHQFDLLSAGQPERADKLMAVMDQINRAEGKGSVFLAAQGITKSWEMRRQYMSPQYTTQWSDVPVVKA